MSSTVADVHENAKRERKISYYQWVPFFLLISAACFRLPSLLWKHFADYSGIRIQQIIKLASDANNIKPDIKAANIRALCVHLQGALRFHRRLQRRNIRPHRVMRMFNIQYSAYYVCIMYLFTKFLFLLNVALQLWLMNSFLGTDKYRFYGFGAVRDLLNGTSWEQSGVFPRVSLCDFTVRVMGNIQDYTIQCVLVINIFNEKIFIFLYLWYLFLLMFTLGSFCYWWVVAFCPCYNVGYIARHLEMSEDPVSVDDYEVRKNIRQFVRNYLKADGMFAIRMLSTYSGVIFGTDLVKALWASYHGIEIARKCKSETDLTKVGVENGKKPGYESYYQRGGGYNRSKDYGEIRRLVPPPNVSPPHDLVKALMDKGSDTSTTPNTSPSKSVTSNNPGVNFSLGEGRLNNFYGGQAPPYPGTPTRQAPPYPGTPTRGTLERRISPPPLRTPNSDSLQRQVFEGRPTSGHGHYSPPPTLSQRRVGGHTSTDDL
uniref:Innexin n=1 Tax=Panagrolaimus sp. PS1159 TaxID=55785 RepID=A0AC35G3Z6_9BILA